MMIVVLPASLVAQSSGGAMLHSDGGVWLNGNPAPNSSAIFLHDLIQTQKDHSAKIDASGSTVTIQQDTIVQFDGDELVLDHGSLQVNTSRGTKVRVNCMTVIPAAPGWTRYDVVDVDGKMQVVAYQSDVNIHYQGAGARSKAAGLSDVTVHQGEQVTREDRCGTPARPAQIVNAKVALLNSVQAKVAGGVVIVAATCFALCHGDNPVSPYKP
jgi:hypothetical protein